jgi:hypothetical protein
MITEGAARTDTAETGGDSDSGAIDDDRLFCYRHPERETWVRCGRCDRPICPRCAMQGPVGFRCRDCGRPAFDPLTSFTTVQAVGGLGVAIGAGILVALIASRIGFFSILISYFAGGVIAEGVIRVTGYKRGPAMLGIVFGGIALGALIGFGIDYTMLLSDLQVAAAAAGQGAAADFPTGSMLLDTGLWALISVGAACAGAWTRLR